MIIEKSFANRGCNTTSTCWQKKFLSRTTLVLLRDRDFIIEAVFEDLTAKRLVLKQISDFAKNDALIATNTSSLLVSKI